MKQGEVWWADLPDPTRSALAYRRPVLIMQADSFNRSRIRTVLIVVLTSKTRLADAPGNVLLPAEVTGLPKDSVANVSQIVTLDKDFLDERVAMLPSHLLHQVEQGLRLVLDL